MDGFMDEQAQDDEQQMDLETKDFVATLELGETPITVDLFDFHRTNKGALSALRRATVTPRDRARKRFSTARSCTTTRGFSRVTSETSCWSCCNSAARTKITLGR